MADDWLGRTLGGRYRVLRRIGEGGIGAVYLAEHLNLGRQVAVKVLHAQYASTDSLRVRFEREARALSVLSHPNIVTVLDFGREGDALFLAMELVEGESLAERLLRGALPPRTALEVMRQILRALADAHARGIVHRDLKPGNVIARTLPDGSEHVVVLDFGLAKFADDDSHAQGEALTRHGALLGTPAYMAPEQVTGGVANAAADVYSAALVFFELATGRRPFTSRDSSELLRAHLIEAPPKFVDVRPDLGASPALEAFLARGLAKAPEARFADARAMLEAFDALPEMSSFARAGVPQPAPAVVPAATTGGKKTPLVLQMAPIDPPSETGAPAYVPPVPSASGTPSQSHGGARSQSHGGTTAASNERSAPSKKLPWGVIAIASASLVLGVGAIGALYAIVSSFAHEEPAPTETPATERPEAPRTAGTATSAPRSAAGATAATPPRGATSAAPSPAAPGASSARVPARNPWAAPVPSEIKGLARRIKAGGEPSRSALKPLYRYAIAHADDPRAPLLLAHTFAKRGWLNDALDQYRIAYVRDASSRGDPSMLSDLVNIAHSDRFGSRASGFVVSWYGSEATAFVQAAIRGTADAEARARLERLRDRLAQAGGAQ